MLRLLHRRNRLIHSHIDCFRFGPVCRLRAITYTTTSLDDDENNDNNGGGSDVTNFKNRRILKVSHSLILKMAYS